ncbi:hypothetical protein BDZ91DRAFT_715772 [Kalaharituber pfeilii]|nr:hypothetical protein BDZ91DRAFT_715772 [Kalaharituber pfeilii]
MFKVAVTPHSDPAASNSVVWHLLLPIGTLLLISVTRRQGPLLTKCWITQRVP